MEYIIISILAITLIICIYVISNMLKKSEKLENMIIDQQSYIDNIDSVIKNANTKLEEIDAKGTFKSDDEIGWFFKNILYIQETLNVFRLENPTDDEEKS